MILGGFVVLCFLKVEKLSKNYGSKVVLENISFNVVKGDFVGILGPNASGKTTLLKCLTGEVNKDGGKVFLDGFLLDDITLKARAKKVAFVFHDDSYNQFFTVKEVLNMGRYPYAKYFLTKEDKEIIEKVSAKFKISDLFDKFLYELSSGQKQKVLLAKALIQQPKLLLLDEPTSSLDIRQQFLMLSFLKNMQFKENLTFIVVLHDIRLAKEFCNKVIFLKNGKLVTYGRADVVLTAKNVERVFGIKVFI